MGYFGNAAPEQTLKLQNMHSSTLRHGIGGYIEKLQNVLRYGRSWLCVFGRRLITALITCNLVALKITTRLSDVQKGALGLRLGSGV